MKTNHTHNIILQTATEQLLSVLQEMAEAHRKNAAFYHNMKDRTYDASLMAVEIMHNDSARIIENIITKRTA